MANVIGPSGGNESDRMGLSAGARMKPSMSAGGVIPGRNTIWNDPATSSRKRAGAKVARRKRK